MGLRTCIYCGELSRIAYYLPLEIWGKIMEDPDNSNVCYKCFIKKADEAEVPWKETIQLYPLDDEGNILW